jgi:predicted nucleic acid-binding protein
MQPAPCWIDSLTSRLRSLALVYLELANALAVSERNRRITRADLSEFIALIGRLPIVVDATTLSSALRTVLDPARSEGLSAYEASYLELAMRRGVPLATKNAVA